MELRETFESGSPKGTVTFLRALERKSFWDFVDIALTYLLSDPPAPVRSYIKGAIRFKTDLYEKLPGASRNSIEEKLVSLKWVNSNQAQDLVSMLEFFMRTA